MKIQLNLSSVDYKKIALIKLALNGISLFSGILLIVNIYNYNTARYGLKETEEGINRLRNQEIKIDEGLKKDRLLFSVTEMEMLNKRIASINSLLLRKSSFWTLLLSHLEAEAPKNISINTIKPSFTDGNIDLSGEAFSLKDLTDFIIKLEGSPNFKDVFLISQKVEGKEREIVTFSLKVKYKPS